MRIAIRHQLSVQPPQGTAHSVLQVLLTPQSGPTQTIASWTVQGPGMEAAGQFSDAFANAAHLVNQNRPEGELIVTVAGIVETMDRHGVLGRMAAEPVPAVFKRITPLTKAPVTLYGKFRSGKDSRVDTLHALMMRVNELVSGRAAQSQSQRQGEQGQVQMQASGASIDPATAADAPPPVIEGILPLPPASDYAHLFIGSARALDIPARYVTGYLQGAEEGTPPFHAWAEAYDDGLGWIGFDSMLGMCPTDRHVRLAVGLDAYGAQPLRCVPMIGKPEEREVSVERAEG